MTRATVDFGIDLGTTNSAIAVLNGTRVEVIKNNEDFEYTPSAVWLNKQGAVVVGRDAKRRLEADPDNAFSEFKLQMGKPTEYRFARSGHVMKPEDLSAEVLKSLKADVRQRLGEELAATVITVPAAFELPQCDATNRAAQLAGFAQSPLLQEPVAAALAYGFQSESDKVFWMAYDLGGGTFDSAVIQVRDGLIQVVNHGGDNHLGGKLIDWSIVEQLLIPALTQTYSLSDFRRGNARWRGAIAKLKLAAEEAKIRVSRDETATIWIEYLCQDDQGHPVEFEYVLKREEVERLAEPLILRSINISKKVLAEKRLGTGDIEKVLLVGGPTLMPYLRRRLSDPDHGLGIPLEFSENPLTVVAQGAAVFAGTHPRKRDASAVVVGAGQYAVELEYEPMGPDTEPLVGGKVVSPHGWDLSGFSVEFVNSGTVPEWRSGRLPLAPNGAFMTTLLADKGRPNTFLIELYDATGTRYQTVPDRLTYTPAVVATDLPLIHSVGVALANNEVEHLLEKGTPLAARGRKTFRTAFEVRQGQAGDVIRIPVVEGENRRADRNRRIGILEVMANQVRRTVPVGSDVEVTIEIDESRLVRTTAYIPVLDEEYEQVLHLGGERSPDPHVLRQEADQERDRLDEARRQAEETGDPHAQEILHRIDSEQILHDVYAQLDAATVDPDAADKCERRLLDLKVAIDEVEGALEWPALVAESKELLRMSKEIIDEHGEYEDKQGFRGYEAQVQSAMQSREPDVLRQRLEEMRGLVMRVLDRKGVLQIIFFQQLSEMKSEMRDQAQAGQLITRGLQALSRGDVADLRAVNRQLVGLLPTPPLPPDLSTVMR
jgi:molecular chaperone DnaK